jgi:hypothetical protein
LRDTAWFVHAKRLSTMAALYQCFVKLNAVVCHEFFKPIHFRPQRLYLGCGFRYGICT